MGIQPNGGKVMKGLWYIIITLIFITSLVLVITGGDIETGRYLNIVGWLMLIHVKLEYKN